MACLIDQGGVFDCAALNPGGIADFAIAYNLQEWKNAVKVVGVDGEITGITNAVGEQGFEFDAADETNIVPGVALRPVEGNADKYDHSMQFTMFEQDQKSRNNVSKMRFANTVFIVYKNSGVGLVYGSEIGMRMEEIIDNPQDPNTGDVVVVSLKTKDTAPGEPNLPIVIDAGDPVTTLALIKGLTTPGS